MVYCHRPIRITENDARQRSFPSNFIGTSVHCWVVSGRYRSRTVSASCPSAKASASTTTSSPTVRLIGNLPRSISGQTPSMATRCLPRSSFMKSVTPLLHEVHLDMGQLIICLFTTQPPLQRLLGDGASSQTQRNGQRQDDPSEYDGEGGNHDFLRNSQLVQHHGPCKDHHSPSNHIRDQPGALNLGIDCRNQHGFCAEIGQ